LVRDGSSNRRFPSARAGRRGHPLASGGVIRRGGQTCRALSVHPEILTGKRPSCRLAGGTVFLIRQKRAWRSGRSPKRSAFPRPVRDHGPTGPFPQARQRRPTRRRRSARRLGRVLAGGFGPRLVKGQRGAVAGAIAPAIEAMKVLSSLRPGTGNATCVSPARAELCPTDRQVRDQQQASACKGRGALVGGFGPRRARGTHTTGPGRRPRPDLAGRADICFGRAASARPALFSTPLPGTARLCKRVIDPPAPHGA